MSPAANDGLPPIDFATYLLSLVQVAHEHLGERHLDQRHLVDGANPARDLAMARHDIDLLTMLQEKTRGNLTGEEERILENALYELRMRYVELSKEG